MTNINDMTNEIMKQLEYYAEDVKEKVETAKNETATEIEKRN